MSDEEREKFHSPPERLKCQSKDCLIHVGVACHSRICLNDSNTAMALRLPFKKTILWMPFKKAILWMLTGSTLLIIAVLHIRQNSWYKETLLTNDYANYDVIAEEPLDQNQSCHLPRIHPFDPSILQYLVAPKPIYCKARQSSLTFIDKQGFLRFNESALKESNYDPESLSCTYAEIHRPENLDSEVSYSEEKSLSPKGIAINSDFVWVSCKSFAGIALYNNIHAHIKAVPSPPRKIPITNNTGRKLNVLIMGFDSVSRLSFIRDLPKSYGYLTKTMGSHIFRGMTKVGDNTFPNLVALLTGKSPFGELETPPDGVGYDNWPLIWKNFSDAGYVTMFAEDRPEIALFNYYRSGFRYQPTTHYMRPFWLEAEKSAVNKYSSTLCYGPIPKHFLMLNYSKDFVTKYDGLSPFFGFSFFVEISHDYMSRISAADEDIASWLRDMYEGGYLNDTIFILMSDHGHRFSALRATLVGRIEERMPFFSMYVPPSLIDPRSEVAKNLETNVKRLITFYDVYYTLLDIINYVTSASSLGQQKSDRGKSLFGPIPPNRTCASAGISDHYCTCEEEISLELSDPRVNRSALEVMNWLNKMVLNLHGNFSQCRYRTLNKINSAELVIASHKVIDNSRIEFGKLYKDSSAKGMITKVRIQLEADPERGLFDATVLHRPEEDSYSVVGEVSRINKYGSQSWCIDDIILKKFCYCVHQPSPS